MSRVLAGPFCCMMLADHGADVIKVEPPEGDETRPTGPPFVDGESTYYLGSTATSARIALDLATEPARNRPPAGGDQRRARRELSDRARWSAGGSTTPRCGAESAADLPRRSPASGARPYANVAGYDGALQAFGGFMSINGEADGEPLKAGIAIADLATGLFASQAILLALHARAETGLGQQVEVSLLESMLAICCTRTRAAT